MGKKILVLGLLVCALATALPGNALTVTRTIIAPTVGTDLEPANDDPVCTPQDAGCEKGALARHARCAYLLAKEQSQDGTTGKVGYVFSVASVAGSSFTLKPATGSSGDFDVTFYISLGTCEGPTPRGNPTGGADPQPGSGDLEYDNFSHHRFGNESGTIPTRAKLAIVTLFGNANAAFTFNA